MSIAQASDRDETDPLIGYCVRDRFIIERRIDKGGFGAVYLASDIQLVGRKAVIKVLLDSWIDNAEARRKFEHEKEALSRLDHPGIVGIFGAGTLENGKPYLVMPFIEGCNLKNIIDERGALPLSFCGKVIENLTDALAAVHAQRILHRDVKPANIILTQLSDGTIRTRLIDFGIARVYESKISPVTEIEKIQGTVSYTAPEQLQGRLEQTAAVDVFSCSVVLYEMLTGQQPFKPQSVYEMYRLHQEGLKQRAIELRPEIPVKADLLITQGLSYDPIDRPQDIKSFGRALAAALLERADQEDHRQSENLISEVISIAASSASSPADSLSERNKIKDLRPAPNQNWTNEKLSVETEQNREAESSLRKVLSPQPHKAENQKLKNQSASDSEQDDFGYITVPSPPPTFGYQRNNETTGNDKKRRNIGFVLLGLGTISTIGVLLFAGAVFLYFSFARSGIQDSKVETVNSHKTPNPPSTDSNVGSKTPTTVFSGEPQVISYYLTVQRYRDNKPYKEPFRSLDDFIFESGYRVAISFKNQHAGYVYLINETKNEKGETDYYLLFPTRNVNNGMPYVSGGTTSETSLIQFDNNAGTEKVWLIWSVAENPDLAKARQDAFSDKNHRIKNSESINKLVEILRVSPELKIEEIKEESNQRKIISGNGDTLIHLFELKHISN
jgi:serine/threonine protein kinase